MSCRFLLSLPTGKLHFSLFEFEFNFVPMQLRLIAFFLIDLPADGYHTKKGVLTFPNKKLQNSIHFSFCGKPVKSGLIC